MKKIKLLIIIHSLGIGGSEGQVYELIRRLDRKKYAPVICSLTSQGHYVDKIKNEGIRVVLIGPRLRHAVWGIYKLVTLVRKGQFDIVHNEMLIAALFGTIIAKCFHVPVVVNCVRGLGFLHYWYRKPIKRLLYKISDCVVTNSARIESLLLEHRLVKQFQVRVIYNGVDLEKYYPAVNSSSVAKKGENIGLPNKDGPIIGIIASLSPVKNHQCFLRAVPRILQEFPRAMFLLIGNGPLRESLEKTAARYSIQRNVYFLGARTNIEDLLNLMDISVLCSLREGVSNAILESMAAGKIVIATNVGGNPEAIVHGKTGFLFEPSNSEELAQRVIQVLKNRDLQEEMAVAARKRAEELFSMKTMVEQYEELYESLLTQKIRQRNPPPRMCVPDNLKEAAK